MTNPTQTLEKPVVLQELSTPLRKLEAYCRSKDYAGYCKFDALNSPVLEKFFGANPITRLLVTQAVNRVPLPLRQVFQVERKRNPKGIACFVRGYKAQGDKTKVLELADWLLQNDSVTHGTYSGPGRAWGYQFPWQSAGFFAPRHSPNCIVTVFVGEAMLDSYAVTQQHKYLDAAIGAKEYITRSLPVLEESPAKLCIGYVEKDLRWKVININAVAAGFLAKLAKVTGNATTLETSRRMVNWVISARDPSDWFWNYTAPKSQSGLGPDNYHTGGILDGIHDYMEVSGDRNPEETFRSGLKFYEEKFFTSNGAPKWRTNRTYPIDIHGVAQGILTFTKVGKTQFAARVADWAVRELHDPVTGRFYYQKHRVFTRKTDLMRWNNSWMFWALSELQKAQTSVFK